MERGKGMRKTRSKKECKNKRRTTTITQARRYNQAVSTAKEKLFFFLPDFRVSGNRQGQSNNSYTPLWKKSKMIWFLIDGGQSVVVCHYLLFDHFRKLITKKNIMLIFAYSTKPAFSALIGLGGRQPSWLSYSSLIGLGVNHGCPIRRSLDSASTMVV